MMRKKGTVLAVLFLSMMTVVVALASPATAQPAAPKPVAVAKADVTIQAWECARGDFCVWENTNGTGRRCAWSGADPDWWSGNIVCSWADDTPVESAFNNGTDPKFFAVQPFRDADYQNGWYCFRPGYLYNVTAGGVKFRSHKWVTYQC